MFKSLYSVNYPYIEQLKIMSSPNFLTNSLDRLHFAVKKLEYEKPSIVSEHKTKDVQGQGPSNINLNLFVCFFNVCLLTCSKLM